jgi:L-ascorbate metabolism protein UlaG (beta-lactamase superfamily)
MKSISLILASLVLLLTACAKPAAPAPTATPMPATATPTVAPTKVPTMTLTYQDNAQVELVTPTGRHIYIDVYNPAGLTKDPTADDILLTTHLHNDHYYPAFQESFPGKQLFTAEGRIELPDVTITGIASAHNSGDPIQSEKATDYIYIIESAGLRIAHFGDIGQDALTEAQLAAIGTIDLAITQFSNSFSSMNADNLKGFNLMEQVKPRLIIPTHSDQATIKIAAGKWKGFYSENRTVSLSTASTPTETSLLVLGNLSIAYAALFKLDTWK